MKSPTSYVNSPQNIQDPNYKMYQKVQNMQTDSTHANSDAAHGFNSLA